jgi:hypothetical protein
MKVDHHWNGLHDGDRGRHKHHRGADFYLSVKDLEEMGEASTTSADSTIAQVQNSTISQRNDCPENVPLLREASTRDSAILRPLAKLTPVNAFLFRLKLLKRDFDPSQVEVVHRQLPIRVKKVDVLPCCFLVGEFF